MIVSSHILLLLNLAVVNAAVDLTSHARNDLALDLRGTWDTVVDLLNCEAFVDALNIEVAPTDMICSRARQSQEIIIQECKEITISSGSNIHHHVANDPSFITQDVFSLTQQPYHWRAEIHAPNEAQQAEGALSVLVFLSVDLETGQDSGEVLATRYINSNGNLVTSQFANDQSWTFIRARSNPEHLSCEPYEPLGATCKSQDYTDSTTSFTPACCESKGCAWCNDNHPTDHEFRQQCEEGSTSTNSSSNSDGGADTTSSPDGEIAADDIPIGSSKTSPSATECGLPGMPPAVLQTCTEPIPDGVPDISGTWVTAGHMQRIEQCGGRLVVSGPGSAGLYYIHDFPQSDGTTENGVNDFSAFDFPTCKHIQAAGSWNGNCYEMKANGMVAASRCLNEDGSLTFKNVRLPMAMLLTKMDEIPAENGTGCGNVCGEGAECYNGKCVARCHEPCCTPGAIGRCNSVAQCVCNFDQYCCLTAWDAQCVEEARLECHLKCF